MKTQSTTCDSPCQSFCSFDCISSSVGKWLDEHPVINKIVVVANHLFRAIAMYALMAVMPFSLVVNCAISLAASILYRVTIERFCHFRFAIPACLGGLAMHLASPSLDALISGVAGNVFASAVSIIGVASLTAYSLGVIWITDSAVNSLNKQKDDDSCCCAT